jgi:hypothetical protein
VGNWSSVP